MKTEHDTLTTERLALRRFTANDLELLCRLYGDEEVMRHAGGVKDRTEAEMALQTRILGYYPEHPGLGVWVTFERASGESVGVHLLNHIQGEQFIQVGYLLFPKFWGRGYATEMAVEVLRYGFVDLGLPRIVAITQLANVPSQHVLIKAGLQRNGERSFAHPSYAEYGPFAWFERDAAPWLGEHAGETPTSMPP